MSVLPTRTTLTDTLVPYTTLDRSVFAGVKRIEGAGCHRGQLGTDAHRVGGAPAFDRARLRQVRWAVLLLGFAARHRALQPVHRRFALAFYLLARRRVVVDARRYLR